MNCAAASPSSAWWCSNCAASEWRASAVAIVDHAATDESSPGESSTTCAPASSSSATTARNALRTSSSTRREAQVLGDGDAEGARVGDGRFEIVDAEAVTVARMPTGERPEHQPRVVHRARERAVGDERLPAHRARLARDQPERRLEADEAAERRGDADRAAPVASQRKRAETGGDRGGGSPGRPAGRAIEVPRVARAAVDGRFRDPEVAELRRRRLGVDHRPGGFEPFDRRRRLGGHEVLAAPASRSPR